MKIVTGRENTNHKKKENLEGYLVFCEDGFYCDKKESFSVCPLSNDVGCFMMEWICWQWYYLFI